MKRTAFEKGTLRSDQECKKLASSHRDLGEFTGQSRHCGTISQRSVAVPATFAADKNEIVQLEICASKLDAAQWLTSDFQLRMHTLKEIECAVHDFAEAFASWDATLKKARAALQKLHPLFPARQELQNRLAKAVATAKPLVGFNAQKGQTFVQSAVARKQELEHAAGHKDTSWSSLKARRMKSIVAEMDAVVSNLAWKTKNGDGVPPRPPDEICAAQDRRKAYIQLVHRELILVSVPSTLQVELRTYQVEGFEWLCSLWTNRLSGLLADEMGLGKTIQTIALLAWLSEVHGNVGPHLVISPVSVVENWRLELARCLPDMFVDDAVIVFHSSNGKGEDLAARISQRAQAKEPLVVLTSYGMCTSKMNHFLQTRDWQLLVVDEGHRMKNEKSVFSQAMRDGFNARMKLLLTGTPLQNNLGELFALLNYLLPDVFPRHESCHAWFAAPLKQELNEMKHTEKDITFTKEEEEMLIYNLHSMLAPFLMQRTKKDVFSEESLPLRREEVVRVQLSAWQQQVYGELQQRSLAVINAALGISLKKMNNILMQLRKAALHPFLFNRAGKCDAEDVVRSSGKLEVLDRILMKLLPGNHKILIFSQFTSMLDILGDFFALRSHQYVRIDGSTSMRERQRRIAMFSEDPSIKIFLLSTRAGGLGLNLQAADTVILFDVDWNPQMDRQAIARAHRIGQQKEVLVLRLLTNAGVERRMEQRTTEKLDLERQIMGGGDFCSRGHGRSPEERAAFLQSCLSTNDSFLEGLQPCTTPSELNALLLRYPGEQDSFEAVDLSLGLSVQSLADQADTANESLLLRCGRLMSLEELPVGFSCFPEDEDSGVMAIDS